MTLSAYPTLLEKLDNKRYRRAFRSATVRNFISLQIRALRKALFETQSKLAEACDTSANVIARLENPNYGKMSVSTLLDLADAYDVGLQIRFVPFEEMAEQIENLSDEALLVPTFREERTRSLPAFTPQNDWIGTGYQMHELVDVRRPLGNAPSAAEDRPEPIPNRLAGAPHAEKLRDRMESRI